MTTPLAVDVVIDNHNYGSFLRASIESALGQTHPDVRVIVVDDGSTDDSRKVIDMYTDQVTAICKPNGGQASAMNAGYARGTGDIVIFLDADDRLLPDAATFVVEAFARQPEAVKVQYRMHVIDASGRRTGTTKPPPHLRMPSGDVREDELIAPFDLTWLPPSATAFRRRAIERIMPLPEDGLAVGADWNLQHLSALLGPVVALDVLGAEYRVHGRNAYELPAGTFDLDHVRQSIVYAASTRLHLERLASELGLSVPAGGILSVADLANRLMSLCLAPAAHPITDDTKAALVANGVRAALRRRDVTLAMRAGFCAWFAAIAVAPRAAARWFAERFLLPELRPRLTRVLQR